MSKTNKATLSLDKVGGVYVLHNSAGQALEFKRYIDAVNAFEQIVAEALTKLKK
jgi:hypothetical protein